MDIEPTTPCPASRANNPTDFVSLRQLGRPAGCWLLSIRSRCSNSKGEKQKMRGTLRVPLIFCARRIKLQLIIYSEIFDLRRMWNNFLAKIVKYCSVVAMWNEICPHSRQRIFHICKANISQRSYFTCPKGKFRWKKHLLSQVLFSGSPCWTWTNDSLINSQVLYRLS